MIFVIVKVRDIAFRFFHTETTFAAIAGNVLTAAFKAVDRKHTVVHTSAAASHSCCVGKVNDIVEGEHGCLFRLMHVALACDQCSAERTHDTCDIRADRITACDLLEASQNCIIIEGTALNHDILTEIGSRCDLNYLK